MRFAKVDLNQAAIVEALRKVGKKCAKCGGVEFGPRGQCKVCVKSYNAEYNIKNKAKSLAVAAAYRAAHGTSSASDGAGMPVHANRARQDGSRL